MPIGRGKYDDYASLVGALTNADGVMVIVFNGNQGTGFAAQFTNAEMVLAIPEVLRTVADQIEKDNMGM